MKVFKHNIKGNKQKRYQHGTNLTSAERQEINTKINFLQ